MGHTSPNQNSNSSYILLHRYFGPSGGFKDAKGKDHASDWSEACGLELSITASAFALKLTPSRSLVDFSDSELFSIGPK